MFWKPSRAGVPPHLRFTLAVSLFAGLVSAAGCSTSRWRREPIYSRDQVFLYREFLPAAEGEEESPPRPQYAHPADVPAETLRILFERLHYRVDPLFGSPRAKRVFTDEEAAHLAPQAAEGLAKLEPHERLRFLVTRSGLARILQGTSGVSGVIFVDPAGVLHIAFDAIDEGINEGERGRPEEVVFPYDPTALDEGEPLIPLTGTRLHRDASGTLYPRWLEVPLAALAGVEAKPAPAGTAQAASPGENAPASGARPAASPEAPPSRAETAGPPPAPPAEAGSGAGGGKEAAPPPSGRAPSKPLSPEERYEVLKRKIETLKRLKADGVITEEEYQEQLERLLED